YSEYAHIMADLIVPSLEESPNQDFSTVIGYFNNWDYTYEPSETAASILDVFTIHLARNVFQDEMGSTAYQYFISFSATPARILIRMLRNNSSFFDDITTPQTEQKGDIIRQTMQESISYLQAQYGQQAYAWHWGNLHQLTLRPTFF